MNCDNQNNNGCGCNCNPNPTPAPAPADISMSVCDRNINMLPMLQTYTTKVLKPNIEGCCKKNILTQQMMSCEGYKYVIKWDFDLDGKTITVPKNCILEFDGGSLKNGTIIGQNTLYINVGDTEIWGENLTREGTWREHSGGGIPDKEYDPEHNSGLGRKTLEPNGGNNVLTQEDFTDANTVYVITQDFTLGGNEILMPENCTVDFEGGSLSDGKLISNNTSVIGNIRGNALWGAYYRDGEYLTQNYLPKTRLKYGMDYAWILNNSSLVDNFIQNGIAVDDNYIYCVGHNSSGVQDGMICLFDRQFNFIGSCTIENTHGNDAVIVDGKLYLAEYNNGSYVGYIDTNIVINACQNNGEIDPSDINTIDLGKSFHGIDYDFVNNEFVLLGDALYFYTFDIENNDYTLKKTIPFISIVNNYFASKGFDPNESWVSQTILYKNGVLLYGYDMSAKIMGTPNYPALLVFDCATEKILGDFYMDNVYPNTEIEGLTKDTVTNDIIVSFYGGDMYQTYFNIVGKLSIDKDIVTNDMYSNVIGNDAFEGNTVVFVDNSYTGVGTGAKTSPFKTFESAMILTKTTSNLIIHIKNTGTEYKYFGRINCGASVELIGVEDTNIEPSIPTLHAEIYTRGHNLTLKKINFKQYRRGLRIHTGSLFVENSTIVNEDTESIYPLIEASYSDLEIQNCRLETSHAILDCYNTAHIIGSNNTFIGDILFRGSGAVPQDNFLINNTVEDVTRFTDSASVLFYNITDNESKVNSILSKIEGKTLVDGTIRLFIPRSFDITDDSNPPVRIGTYRCGEYYNETGSFRGVDGGSIIKGALVEETDFAKLYSKGFKLWEGYTYYDKATNKLGFSKDTGSAQAPNTLVDYIGNPINTPVSGTTRPTDVRVGTIFFDTTLGKPIWYKGSNVWVDATGVNV